MIKNQSKMNTMAAIAIEKAKAARRIELEAKLGSTPILTGMYAEAKSQTPLSLTRQKIWQKNCFFTKGFYEGM